MKNLNPLILSILLGFLFVLSAHSQNSELNPDNLNIYSTSSIPPTNTKLNLSELIFKTNGSGLATEEWRLGRTADGSNPPLSTFRIYRFAVGIMGGATFNTGLSITNNMLVGIGNIDASQKLDVDGNARFRSVGSSSYNAPLNITSTGVLTTSTSDLRLKENVVEIGGALDNILAMRGVQFNWKADENKEKRIGFIAQEVEKVVPELVYENPVDGYLGVRYEEVTALLVQALKEQQIIIQMQQVEIEGLKTMVNGILKLEN